MVSMDGEIIELGSLAPDSAGPELLSVFVGSEGMLGVVTEVTLRLTPKPALARVVMASFDDVEKASQAVAQIIGAGIIPAGLEMMDKQATQMVEPFVKAGYDTEAEAILLLLSERGVAASAGAACSSGSLEPSPVLRAMGLPDPVAHGTIRLSVSRSTTAGEIDHAPRVIPACIERLRLSSSASVRGSR
jgi:FAD/FMN-containing dehydrogenase